MKNYALLSILTAFALPLALSAEESSDNQKTSENSLVPTAESPLASHDGCAPKKVNPPREKRECPKPEPKCKSKPKPRCWNDECNPTSWSLQARGAAFLPLKHQLREIYGTALPAVELEGSYSLIKWSDCNQLLLWGNVGWAFKTGKTIGFGYYTRLNLVPISLGVEYQYNIARNIDVYVGIAPAYSFLNIKLNDGFSTVHIHKSQFGLMTKTGFRFTFATNFFFDIFGDYYYTQFGKMKNSIQNIDNHFSGFFVGAGFGGKW